ncbi:MAG: hypothetical protein JXA33_04395 [Anaerolineae bacterium]|nr:hypothetical protein [Anaerolineae bacterium]
MNVYSLLGGKCTSCDENSTSKGRDVVTLSDSATERLRRYFWSARWGWGIVVVAIYTIVALVGSWPLVLHLTTHLPDRFNDSLLHSWNTWWVQQALQTGQPLYYTRALFYPDGVSLVTQNIAWFHTLPSLLLARFCNPVATYNLATLFNLVLCGCVVFWVTYQLTHDTRAAFIAGLIYQMWPYRMARLDLPNLLATYWIPIFLFLLLYTLNHEYYWSAVPMGISFALVGYVRWQLLIPAALMGIIMFLLYARRWLLLVKHWHLLKCLGLAAIVAVVCLLPALGLLLRDDEAAGNVAYSGDEEVLMSTDLLAYLTPSPLHPIFGKYTQKLYDRYYFDREDLRRRPAYIGLIPLLLAIAGIYYARPRSVVWSVMALLLMHLSSGPVWRLNGRLYDTVPTLYRIMSPLGILELIRDPERFTIVVALPVAILAAYGLTGLLRALENSKLVSFLSPQICVSLRFHALALKLCLWSVTLVLGSVIFFEYFAPQTVLRDFSQPAALYQQLADEPGEFAILNLPFDALKSRRYMYDQITHRRPILQGNISRIPSSVYAYINRHPWLATLRATGEMSPEFPDVSRQLDVLAKAGIRYLVLHKDMVGHDRIEHWQHYLLTQPRYEDEALIAYTTEYEAGRDFRLDEEWLPGLGPLRIATSAHSLLGSCLHAGHVLLVDIGWGSTRAIEQDVDVSLSLVDSHGEIQSGERFPLVEEWPTQEWPAQTLAWGHYLLHVPALLPPDTYTLTSTFLDAGTGTVIGGPHPVETVIIQQEICNLATVAEATDTNALFGDELRLVEYTLERSDQRLDFQFYWRAERYVDNEYTIFVHVYDPATAVPVAQNDVRPRQGAYPMRFWRPGEIVDDRVSVSLSGVPAGEYGIAIGVYNGATGERLPLLDNQGEPLVDDGRLILSETVTIP